MFWEEGAEVGCYRTMMWGLMMREESNICSASLVCAMFEYKHMEMPKFNSSW